MEQNKIQLPKFKLLNKLKLHCTYGSLVECIIEEIKKIPDLNSLKMNPDLTKMICTVVEEICSDKKLKGKIEKKSLVVEVLQKSFDLNEEEQKLLSSNIDFICDNDMIKRISTCHKIFKFFF